MKNSNSEFPQLNAGMDGGFHSTHLPHWPGEFWARKTSGWLISTWICGKNIGIWFSIVFLVPQNPSVLNKNLWKNILRVSLVVKPYNHQHVIIFWSNASFHPPKKGMFSPWIMYAPLGQGDNWILNPSQTTHTHLTFVKFCRSKQYQNRLLCEPTRFVGSEHADCTSSLCSAVSSC